MKFFDTTPTARILTRFSKDMDEGDLENLLVFNENLLVLFNENVLVLFSVNTY